MRLTVASSTYDTDKFFTGTVLDDIAITAGLGHSTGVVLGIGSGNTLFNWATTSVFDRLIGVDYDPTIVQFAELVQRVNRLENSVDLVEADAGEFVERNTFHDALIAVDIFDGADHSPLLEQANFWSNLSRNRTSTVVVNTLGFASYLRPFEGDTPHAIVNAYLREHWRYVWYLESQGNIALVARHEPLPEIEILKVAGVDFVQNHLLALSADRLKNAKPTPTTHQEGTHNPLSSGRDYEWSSMARLSDLLRREFGVQEQPGPDQFAGFARKWFAERARVEERFAASLAGDGMFALFAVDAHCTFARAGAHELQWFWPFLSGQLKALRRADMQRANGIEWIIAQHAARVSDSVYPGDLISILFEGKTSRSGNVDAA